MGLDRSASFVADDLDHAVDEITAEALRQVGLQGIRRVQETSPFVTGQYRGGWTARVDADGVRFSNHVEYAEVVVNRERRPHRVLEILQEVVDKVVRRLNAG